MAKFEYTVKFNGRRYKPGEEVPIPDETKTEAPKKVVEEKVVEEKAIAETPKDAETTKKVAKTEGKGKVAKTPKA